MLGEAQVPAKLWRKVVLCADDFALSEGISDAIEQLAELGHLSAASAIVTGGNWHRHGARLARLRERIAIGLHLNFTLGAPLGSMGRLAPKGRFPTIGELSCHALCGNVDPDEIADEIERQIARFTEGVGTLPDFLDGHQHVHVLPGVRRGVLAALKARFPAGDVFVRDPADRLGAIVRRGVATKKAVGVALLAYGFAAECRRVGAVTNVGFAGFSNFDTAASYADEFPRFFICPGPQHLVMCHPGFADADLASLDPVTGRREEEFFVIRRAGWLRECIWRPQRGTGTVWASERPEIRA